MKCGENYYEVAVSVTSMAQVDMDSGHESLVSNESPVGDFTRTPPNLDSKPPDIGLGGCDNSRPPRITPFSGVLGKGKVVVRPVAFKPMMTPSARFSNAGERYGSTPILARPGSQLTLYGSNSDLRHHGRNSNYSLDRKLLSSCASMSSSPPLAMASLTSLPLSSGRKMVGYDSLESVRKSPISNSSQNIHNIHNMHNIHNNHTNNSNNSRMFSSKCSSFHLLSGGDGGSLIDLAPSPSDSSAPDLETALRERDAELVYLRQTMEHNEQVIVRVYQEKERVWERELRRIKSAHENRLRASAQKALKLEQMLMMQTYQLQEDKKRILEEGVREATELRQEVDLLRGRLEETEWGLCQKTGELALIKTQLKDAQIEQTTKGHELVQLRSQLREQHAGMEQRDLEMTALRRDAAARDVDVASLRAEVELLTQENATLTTSANQRKERHEEDIARFRAEMERVDSATRQAVTESHGKMAASQVEVDKLQGEVTALSKELESTKSGSGSKRWAGEWTQREDVEGLEHELQGVTTELAKMNKAKEWLEREVERLGRVHGEEQGEFERERVTWAQEKEKVLRYQRQLQLNYIQMFRRTRSLETEVESLTLELELETKGARTNSNQKQLPAIEMGHTIEL